MPGVGMGKAEPCRLRRLINLNAEIGYVGMLKKSGGMVKKILVAMVLATSFALPPAFAQAEHFSGWSVGANLNFVSSSTKFVDGSATANMGDTSANTSLQAAYVKVLGSHGVLGFGATYGLGDLNAGSLDVGGTHVSFKTRNLYFVYIEPGYALSDATLIYAKIAKVSLVGEESYGGVTASKTFGGTGLGLGIRLALDKNLHVQVEFLQAEYNMKNPSARAYQPSASTGSIGLGYRF